MARLIDPVFSLQLIINLQPVVGMEGNFGGCKLWRIRYKNAVGEINFGKFVMLFSIEETLVNLWSFAKSTNVSTLQSFPPYGICIGIRGVPIIRSVSISVAYDMLISAIGTKGLGSQYKY